MGIAIREEAALQHLVGREADTFYNILGVEGSLFHFSEVVFGITVQFQDTYILQWKIFMRPNLRQVEWIDAVMIRFFLGH